MGTCYTWFPNDNTVDCLRSTEKVFKPTFPNTDLISEDVAESTSVTYLELSRTPLKRRFSPTKKSPLIS